VVALELNRQLTSQDTQLRKGGEGGSRKRLLRIRKVRGNEGLGVGGMTHEVG